MKKLALTISLLALAAGTQAQDERPVYPANSDNVSYAEIDKLPDWRGIWQPAIGRVGGDQPMLIGAYKEHYESERAKVAADPNYETPEGVSNCEPEGMPTMMTMPYSLEFLFTPGKIVVNQEALMMVRRIYTDGRPLPSADEIDPNYFGYSVGHWEGDTLVVDTVGFNERFWLHRDGFPHTESLHLIERLSRPRHGLLRYEITIDDPGAYTGQWSTFWEKEWTPGEELIEYFCQDNNVDQYHMMGNETVN